MTSRNMPKSITPYMIIGDSIFINEEKALEYDNTIDAIILNINRNKNDCSNGCFCINPNSLLDDLNIIIPSPNKYMLLETQKTMDGFKN